MKSKISNLKYQISNVRNESGFTLIELLVVMTAFMLTGTIIASVIFTHVKAIDKTNTETNIRQAGNSIISQMSKDIRNAGSIDLQETSGGSLISVQKCSSADYLIINTHPKIDTQNESSYQCISFNIRQHIVSGTAITPAVTKSEFLLEANSVIVNNCKFTCQVTPGGLPVITINFTLDEPVRDSAKIKSNSIGQKVSIPFMTSVEMRNVQ